MSDDELRHIGTPRHSGRYEWGSGKNAFQRDASFLGNINKLRKQGLKDTVIAKGMGMNTREMRAKIHLAGVAQREALASEAVRLKDKGWSNSAIGRRLGKNESSVRLLLDSTLRERNNLTEINANILKEAVAEKKYIDVSKGVEHHMGISDTRLKNAVALLKEQGYNQFPIYVTQLGTGKETKMNVLTAPETTMKEVYKNSDQIRIPTNLYSEDGGETVRKIEPPKSISSERVAIRYAEDGGADKDGTIEIRRGVEDLNLGKAHYIQTRVLVDNSHYLKGMAVYGDDMPKGVDIVFNTNKGKDKDKLEVMKPISVDDPDNPFGASIKGDDKLIRFQRHYKDANGKEQLSPLNAVSEEGNWDRWSKTLASQMLSKQPHTLAERQLSETRDNAKAEFDEIMALTNPTVRASLLDKFASQCDSDATHLQAAALPRQSTKVLLPYPDINPKEAYLTDYEPGEQVALIRYPHAGTFEIPIVTVTDKHPAARKQIGNSIDAIGIHPKTAEQLSGADFDGDSVIVIPIGNVKLKATKALRGLTDFNPKELYKHYDGMHKMTDREKGLEMGMASNLITDMTIKGATPEELCKAVKHSMVVIDAQKHYLDYKRSFVENDIASLRATYQKSEAGGASTLLSKSTSKIRNIPQRKEKTPSKMTPEELKDWKDGKVIWESTGKTYKLAKEMKDGRIKVTEHDRLEGSPQMMETDDAFTLVSGSRSSTTMIESVYAKHANGMKALANEARKAMRVEEDVPYLASARETYKKEAQSLDAKLKIAERNAPLERQAQLIANKTFAVKKYNNPNLDAEHIKRLKGQELQAARDRVGAKKETIFIEDREWEAINAGAISKSALKDILLNANPDRVRQLATPKEHKGMPPGKVARAQSMLAQGHTQADVAEVLGVSTSTLINSIGLDKF